MLYDATGAPLETRSTGSSGLSPESIRRATEGERRYVTKCVRNERRLARLSVFTPIGLSTLFLYLGITENEPTAIVVGLIACAGLAAALWWLYRDSYRAAVDDDPTVKQLKGRFRAISTVTGPAYVVGTQGVKMPVHWSSYLRDGEVVRVHVIPTSAAPYAVRTDSGLSIDDEREHGLLHLVDPHVGLTAILWMVPATGFVLALTSLLLLNVSDGGSVGVEPGLDGLWLQGAILGTLVFGGVAGRILTRHINARRRIHDMYHKRGVRHARSRADRRWFRLRDAAGGALIAALGGALLAVLYDLHLPLTLLAFALLGSGFGAVVREPRPGPAPTSA